MSDPKDKEAVEPPPPAADDRKQSGRVGRDARGNAVWEWESETGVYSRDVSTQRLKKLEAKDLAFLDTGSIKKSEPASPKSPGAKKPLAVTETPKAGLPVKGSGFNPYDSGGRGGFNSSPNSPQPLPEEPKPKRRSIQSIVADQNAKDKKSGER